MIADTIVKVLWKGDNPFAGFPTRLIAPDLQGWTSEHKFLADSIDSLRPQIVIEIGVWKGGSTLAMARKISELGLDGAVIAIDTWLGSWEHWIYPQLRDELCYINGYPHIFEKFRANVVHQGLQNHVVPLPLDSINACNVIVCNSISADLIHIDGGHEYSAVLADLTHWWEVLRHGGIMVVDDYWEDGTTWPGVFRATNEFLANTPHQNFESHEGKCRFTIA